MGKITGLQLSDGQWGKVNLLGYKASTNIALRERHYKV